MSDATPIYIPRENVNDESVTVLRWLIDDGAEVSAGDIVAEVETSKTNLDIEVHATGFLRHRYDEGDEAPIGAAICFVTAEPDTPIAEKAQVASGAAPQTATSQHANIESSPMQEVSGVRFSAAARALIAETGVDAAAFAGMGLVRVADVHAKLNDAPKPAAKPAAPADPAVSNVIDGVPTRREALSRQKRVEAKYLAAGQRDVLLSNVTMPCPTRGLRKLAAEHDVVRGVAAPIFIHEAARALRQYPQFNACHDNGDIVYYESVNIGYAIDGEHGLKVPVIRDADTKDLSTIAEELEAHIFAYVEDRLDVAELAHGTFTITDLSGEGASSVHPLINQGQGAILGIGAEVFPQHAAEGIFNMVLAFDHHLAEGRAAAQFLSELRTRVRGHEDAISQHVRTQKNEPTCSVCQRSMSDLPARVYLLQRFDKAGNVVPICTLCAQGFS